MKSNKIATDALGFPLQVQINVSDSFVKLGTHRTFANEKGEAQIGELHNIDLKEGMTEGELITVASHEAYHLFYSIRHAIKVDEETEAEAFGGLVGAITDFYYKL